MAFVFINQTTRSKPNSDKPFSLSLSFMTVLKIHGSKIVWCECIHDHYTLTCSTFCFRIHFFPFWPFDWKQHSGEHRVLKGLGVLFCLFFAIGIVDTGAKILYRQKSSISRTSITATRISICKYLSRRNTLKDTCSCLEASGECHTLWYICYQRSNFVEISISFLDDVFSFDIFSDKISYRGLPQIVVSWFLCGCGGCFPQTTKLVSSIPNRKPRMAFECRPRGGSMKRGCFVWFPWLFSNPKSPQSFQCSLRDLREWRECFRRSCPD